MLGLPIAEAAKLGYTNEPKRCPSCRRARRLERNLAGWARWITMATRPRGAVEESGGGDQKEIAQPLSHGYKKAKVLHINLRLLRLSFPY
ncbi:MAG: zinc-ribbon domain containing protein [Dehalococcoidia bacterium]|nr:zinc-ribbon domain containing protein [Dehalococcoidia bacterium]